MFYHCSEDKLKVNDVLDGNKGKNSKDIRDYAKIYEGMCTDEDFFTLLKANIDCLCTQLNALNKSNINGGKSQITANNFNKEVIIYKMRREMKCATEGIIERYRKSNQCNCLSRLSSVFSYDEIENCINFINKERKKGKIYLLKNVSNWCYSNVDYYEDIYKKVDDIRRKDDYKSAEILFEELHELINKYHMDCIKNVKGVNYEILIPDNTAIIDSVILTES